MFWHECNGQAQIKPIEGLLYRLVESQEQVATRGYVDTLDEQAVLEELLEVSKPDYPAEIPAALHYLLRTPFRYPPLQWGSRFGRVHEPSLFYGGQSVEATLAESAYYRFVFLFSMQGTPPKARLNTEHTLFSVGYATTQGIQLQSPPFDAYQSQLTDPVNYTVPQQLGSDMRQSGVLAFEYVSARSRPEALCVALYTPQPFIQTSPVSQSIWLCELTQDAVTFKDNSNNQTYHYPLELFHSHGQFPLPAS